MTAPTSRLLEFSGVFTESGGRKPLAYQKLCAPTEAEIVGDWLVWSPGFMSYRTPKCERSKKEFGLSDRMRWNFREPSPEMLLQFVQLAGLPDEAIRTFVLRWGVLSICRKHQLPSSHNPMCGVKRVPRRTYVYAEPVECYRFFARQARAMLRYAIAVRAGREPDRADADTLSYTIGEYRRTGHSTPQPPSEYERAALAEWFVGTLIPYLAENAPEDLMRKLVQELRSPNIPRRRQGHRNALAAHINRWLGLGYVRPHLEWTDDAPRISFGTGAYPHHESLFGNLALQLLMAVSNSSGFAICSACGQPYTPRRSPARNRLRYCKACGMRAAWRLAQRKRRAKLVTRP